MERPLSGQKEKFWFVTSYECSMNHSEQNIWEGPSYRRASQLSEAKIAEEFDVVKGKST